MNKILQYFSNSFKGILILFAASFAFILFISIFPLIGSLTVSGFPLQNIMLDNLHLLIILCAASIPLGFFLGIIAGKLKHKRILWMILLGLVFYWLMILLLLVIFSKFSFSGQDLTDLLKLSVWAMLAYSMFAMPFIIISVFLLERWTRK